MISDIFWCSEGTKRASCRVGRVTVICIMVLVWWASKQLYSYPANTCICWNRPQSRSETQVLALLDTFFDLAFTHYVISSTTNGCHLKRGSWRFYCTRSRPLNHFPHGERSRNVFTTFCNFRWPLASRKMIVLKSGTMFLDFFHMTTH